MLGTGLRRIPAQIPMGPRPMMPQGGNGAGRPMQQGGSATTTGPGQPQPGQTPMSMMGGGLGSMALMKQLTTPAALGPFSSQLGAPAAKLAGFGTGGPAYMAGETGLTNLSAAQIGSVLSAAPELAPIYTSQGAVAGGLLGTGAELGAGGAGLLSGLDLAGLGAAGAGAGLLGGGGAFGSAAAAAAPEAWMALALL